MRDSHLTLKRHLQKLWTGFPMCKNKYNYLKINKIKLK